MISMSLLEICNEAVAFALTTRTHNDSVALFDCGKDNQQVGNYTMQTLRLTGKNRIHGCMGRDRLEFHHCMQHDKS